MLKYFFCCIIFKINVFFENKGIKCLKDNPFTFTNSTPCLSKLYPKISPKIGNNNASEIPSTNITDLAKNSCDFVTSKNLRRYFLLSNDKLEFFIEILFIELLKFCKIISESRSDFAVSVGEWDETKIWNP